MSLDETARFFGAVRFGVHPAVAPHNWHALRKLSGMTIAMANALERAGQQDHAQPREWRGTFEPVPCSAWVRIEVWENGQWIALDGRRFAPVNASQQLDAEVENEETS